MKKFKDFIKENFIQGSGMPRRSFLKLAGLSSVGLGMGFPLKTKWAYAQETSPREVKANWHTNPDGYEYYVQRNILTDWVDDGWILAKIDGWWWAYPVREFDDGFHQWWIDQQRNWYDVILALINEGARIPYGGNHMGFLATYGQKLFNRGDSVFHLNNAPKYWTIIPKDEDTMNYIEGEMQKIYNDPAAGVEDVFNLRMDFYREKDLWDKTKFATLELYTGHPRDDKDYIIPGYKETHTFQNLMENPMANIAYMGLFETVGGQSYFDGMAELIGTFEFRGVCWLSSYYNPNLTPYEKLIVNHLNASHSRQFGMRDDFDSNLFIIVEEFNNTPDYWSRGIGKRVVPPYTYDTLNKIATNPGSKNKKLTKEEKYELLKKFA